MVFIKAAFVVIVILACFCAAMAGHTAESARRDNWLCGVFVVLFLVCMV